MQTFILILAFTLSTGLAYGKEKDRVSKKFHCYHYDQQEMSHQGISLAQEQARSISAEKCKEENQGDEKQCRFKYCVKQTSISTTSN